MKKNILALIVFLVLPFSVQSQGKSTYNAIRSLLGKKDYFAARLMFESADTKLTASDKILISACLDAAFNRPAQSNAAITEYLKKYHTKAGDSLQMEMLRIKQINHARLFEYKDAMLTVNELLSKYGKLLSAEDKEDYNNTLAIWKALQNSPPQQIVKHGDTSLKMTRDLAGLANLDVASGSFASQFIFDTGANFSTVTESAAKAFNMDIREGVIEVGAITGAKVNAHVAICPAFTFGNVTVNNAVFLVFPDTALAFPQIKYQINGIIGFPVIEGLKQIQITRDDRFIIPAKPSPGAERNMALEFLTPLYLLDGNCYTFDTGANSTILYAGYYRANKSEIDSKYSLTDLQYGGAGGVILKKGYIADFTPTVNGKKLNLKNVQLFAEDREDDKKYYYGNIGQDLIRQFSQMTINFADMYIRFD